MTYDWRRHEARLNDLPQFTTIIDGQDIHFVHVRSAEPGALPLIITHGWPGSIVEFLDIIGPFTDPAAHGGDPADAFHVVAPSIPGSGFSGPTHEAGRDTARVAGAWAELMSRLGYERYGAQGGDTGAMVSPQLGRIDAGHVVGVHVNNLLTCPSGQPGDLSDTRRGALSSSRSEVPNVTASSFDASTPSGRTRLPSASSPISANDSTSLSSCSSGGSTPAGTWPKRLGATGRNETGSWSCAVGPFRG